MEQIRELSTELQKVAKNELNENVKTVQRDIEDLRIWLLKEPHITSRTDNQFLIGFLRGCKFSIERSKEKLDMFYSIRTAIPEFFNNRIPDSTELDSVISLGLTLPLPNLEHETAPRIMLIRQGAYDPSKVSIADILKVSYMITDTLLYEDDNTVVCGQVILVDLKGLSLAHLTQYSAVLIKKMTSSIQEAYPIRQKGIHFIHTTSIFETLFKIFFNFLSKKLKKRVYLHENLESLYKVIPKKLLPEEYGGQSGSIQTITNEWRKKLMARKEWFKDDVIYKSDERKRIAASKNADLIFGIDGSFRNLDID